MGGGYGGKIKSSQIRFGGRDRPFGITGDMNKTVQVNDFSLTVTTSNKVDHSRLGRNVRKEGYTDHSKSFREMIHGFDNSRYGSVKPAHPMNKQ